MKRQRTRGYEELDDGDVQLDNRLPRRIEPSMEAEVLDGDTLASVALRFNCTVADLKRLNKIDKDNEIYARKTLRIPITAHNVLLDTLPTVHRSGNNSPNATNGGLVGGSAQVNQTQLDEKLIVASVANSEYVNDVILNSKMANTVYRDFPRGEGDPSITDPLEDMEGPIPTVVLAKPRNGIDWNGSDCDMNWICLFICILALCFAIPLIYVFYIAEEKVHHDAIMLEASHHDATHSGF